MEPENPHQAVAHATNAEDTRQQVHNALAAQLFAQLPRSALASIGFACLTLFVVSEAAIGSRLHWWFGSVVLVSATRLGLAWQYARRAPGRESIWLRTHVSLTLISGITWACLLLTHEAAAHSPAAIYTTLALIGMSAGAITTMAYYAIAYIAFISPPLIGFTAWALMGVQPAQPALAFATIAAFGLLVAAVRRFENALKNTLALGIERQGLLQRLESDHAVLRKTQDVLVREQEVAAHVMESIVEPLASKACGLKTYVQPLHRFDGDVLLHGMSGTGSFRILLGDATGHGLSAAFAAIPAAQTFRAMNRKRFACEVLIEELNGNLHWLLPRDLFLAAALIELSPNSDGSCKATIWNGGLDDLLIVREDSQLDRIPSRNLSLGILAPEAFEAQVENIALAAGDRVYAYSDGLTESKNAAGEGYGRQRLETTLLAAPNASDRLEYALAQQRAFVGDSPLTDDLTLIEIQTDAIARHIQRYVAASSKGDRPHQELGAQLG